jgi:ElaB/YqjD/DUF883 family membrane-anchored ribosome-binding protein
MADRGKAPDKSSPVVNPQTAPAATSTGKTVGPKAQASQREPDAIARDIAGERAQLGKAFDDLRGDLSEAIESAGNRATEVVRQAMLVVPVMAVAVTATVGGLVGGVLALRRHRRK